ncbi:hypothetical protein GCM10022256_22260 [Frondihabitans peucedani]|uniref:Uncharacterized protein n=1 Tax=Frondihabitans peucedani TaxID=598626 RepID=A0ABP8E311_9MICO
MLDDHHRADGVDLKYLPSTLRRHSDEEFLPGDPCVDHDDVEPTCRIQHSPHGGLNAGFVSDVGFHARDAGRHSGSSVGAGDEIASFREELGGCSSDAAGRSNDED